jgi:excisionase family DNA binding protein
MDKNLLTISEVAKILGVSIDTLRRWDKKGQLKSIRSEGGHRYYSKEQIEMYSKDIFRFAENWVLNGFEIPSQFYCSDSSTFQSRLVRMSNDLSQVYDEKIKNNFSLIVAVAGEIGNNSFDHNLGNWPDEPGVFFGFDLSKKIIVLADRGQGILQTLRKVRPGIVDDSEALKIAFTEIISGRAPEERGNGLKFVKNVVTKNDMRLFFKTGDAELEIFNGNPLIIKKTENAIRGCIVVITF